MSDLPDNVRPVRDRHGKIRYRFRKKGYKSAYLKGEPGSAQFYEALSDALKQFDEPKAITSRAVVAPRSLDDLYRRLRSSAAWKLKKPETQLAQGRVYERFLDMTDKQGRRYGERPTESVTVGWLDAIFGGMSDRPGAANDLRKKLAVLIEYSCKLEWRTSNVVRHTTPYPTGKPHHAWTEVDIAAYRAEHELGTMARLTLELALNTAARKCNVAQLTRADIVRGRIITKHVKGNNESSVVMLSMTQRAMDALPVTPIRHLIVNAFGKPYSVGGLGNRMRKWCDAAGLPHCSIHGIRSATSRRIAESGSTDAQGQAVTGHKKAEMFQKYRASANREALADDAMSNLQAHFDKDDVQPK